MWRSPFVALGDLGNVHKGSAARSSGGGLMGLWEPEEGRLSIVSQPGMREDGLHFRVTLAHDIAHALDDERHGLLALTSTICDDLASGEFDRSAAVRAVVVGSATREADRWMMAWLQENASDKSELRAMARRWRREARQVSRRALAQPAWVRRREAFPYVAGARFLEALAAEGDAIWADPPSTTEQVLHPEPWRLDAAPTQARGTWHYANVVKRNARRLRHRHGHSG